MSNRTILWLLAMIVGLGLLFWLFPPHEIERRLEREKMGGPPKPWFVICPVMVPCWGLLRGTPSAKIFPADFGGGSDIRGRSRF
jgi:hypothetical protein